MVPKTISMIGLKRTLRRVLLASGAGVVLLSGYAYYLYHKPVQSLANTKADLSIDAIDILTQYASDELAADAKYLNKIISVKGKVSKIEKSDSSFTKIYLFGNESGNVICEMEKASNEVDVKEGELVAIKGLCTGYLMDIVLTKSSIEKK